MRCARCRARLKKWVLAVLPGRTYLSPVCVDDRLCYPYVSPRMKRVKILAAKYVQKRREVSTK
jgi:hypothetical protein